MHQRQQIDFLVAGAGVIGLAVARELRKRWPNKSIAVIEKESDVAYHASGRNSGVLHAGFYYTADSLKAKFTAEGNREMRAYCAQHGIPVADTRKVVVAQSDSEIAGLEELNRRGKKNGVDVSLITASELREIDPNAKTIDRALYSPTTGSVDPVLVCQKMKEELRASGVTFHFSCPFKRRLPDGGIECEGQTFYPERFINAGGLYADKIARQFGFSEKYTILPFKGIYMKYTKPSKPVRINIYPVPNLGHPFLGVHFTLTAYGDVKIGPTAIPAFWRENYQGFKNFSLSEFLQIISKEADLYLRNSFHFRELSHTEMKKYNPNYFVGLAKRMVHSIDETGFTEWSKPGIRAQLLNLETRELVQDFIVEGDARSVHILNAVSPAFTSSIPFARWVVDTYISGTVKN